MSQKTRTSLSGTNWLLQRVTGVGLIVLLGFHFAVEHFIVGAANVTAENTAERMATGVIDASHIFDVTIDMPALLYQATALLLLVFSVYHGMYGAYNVIVEWGVSPRTERALQVGFALLSVALLIQGVLIFLAFVGGGPRGGM